MSANIRVVLLALAALAIACGGGQASDPAVQSSSDAGPAVDAGPGSGIGADAGTDPDAGPAPDGGVSADAGAPVGDPGGGGGGGPIPPPPTVDGPAQFLFDASGAGAPSPDIDFGHLLNTTPGAIPIGAVRSAQELVFNVSKKTPLAITSISIVGPDAADFALDAASVAAAKAADLPPNRGAHALLSVTFSPTASGTRTASLQVISNAGTATAALTGAGLPDQPILSTVTRLDFVAGEGFQTLTLTNQGGPPLVIGDIRLSGQHPEDFQFDVANFGLGNCRPGIELPGLGSCFLGVGLADGAVAPANAVLVITSNDPAHPETDIPLTLTP